VKIDKADVEWKITEGSQTLGFVREFLARWYVYPSGASHTQPLGPFRNFRDALRALEQPPKRKRGQVYFRGALTRRRDEE
jgi:hypothetical protein